MPDQITEEEAEDGSNEEEAEEIDTFGFDGLGETEEDYAAGKVVALAQSGDGAVLFVRSAIFVSILCFVHFSCLFHLASSSSPVLCGFLSLLLQRFPCNFVDHACFQFTRVYVWIGTQEVEDSNVSVEVSVGVCSVDGFDLPLRMMVGAAEAMAILAAAQERRSRRPVTHEAWGSSLSAVGWKVMKKN